MPTDEEFRAELQAVIKRHDLGADDLRDLAADLEATAEKWEALEATL